jgi:hypothetical protein
MASLSPAGPDDPQAIRGFRATRRGQFCGPAESFHRLISIKSPCTELR